MPAARHQLGPPTRHILESKGADTDLMRFYITEYSTNYSDGKFVPRTGAHSGAGYTTNRRPMRTYSAALDELDNPVLGHWIKSGNYLSTQRDHFRPSESANGTEALPTETAHMETGFTATKPLAGLPLSKEANSVHYDKINAKELGLLLPKHRPRLHKLRPKDVTEESNFDHGPSYMTSEAQSKYRGVQRDPDDVKDHFKVGKKLESGFTSNNPPLEPIMFYPSQTFANQGPAELTDRPTEVSMMKTTFTWPQPRLQGDEPLPARVIPRSERFTGFTRDVEPIPKVPVFDDPDCLPAKRQADIRKKNPVEFINVQAPHNHTSVSREVYKDPGVQPEDFAAAKRIGNLSVGEVEPSGFTTNADQHVMTADDPGRFITNYQTSYWNMNPVGKFREGHCRGSVQEHLENAFVRSTQVHSYGPEVNSTEVIRKLDPYQARSMNSRDPYVEKETHTHDHKLHKLPC